MQILGKGTVVNKNTQKLTLDQSANYKIIVVGHLDDKRSVWFEELALVNEYGENNTPITIMTGKVLDQAMLHGLLNKIRDLGLPLLSVRHLEGHRKTREKEEA